ncbi:MAG: HAD hydrolase family protein [Candidatus Omnitrophica bacterium]|nr:HAD hydrolase family protein [Candidatus Omnitrophota bacterium]
MSGKIQDINTLILDVDGVLTDGTMIYGNDGRELKNFHVRDGKGISLAKVAGMRIILMTSEESELIINRAKKLGIENDAYLGIKNKLKCLKGIATKNNLDLKNIAFVGDDINDIPALDKAGLPIAVGDAAEEVKKLVKKRGGFVTGKKGGKGAVREAIETILKKQGRWAEIIEKDIQRQLIEER